MRVGHCQTEKLRGDLWESQLWSWMTPGWEVLEVSVQDGDLSVVSILVFAESLLWTKVCAGPPGDSWTKPWPEPQMLTEWKITLGPFAGLPDQAPIFSDLLSCLLFLAHHASATLTICRFLQEAELLPLPFLYTRIYLVHPPAPAPLLCDWLFLLLSSQC